MDFSPLNDTTITIFRFSPGLFSRWFYIAPFLLSCERDIEMRLLSGIPPAFCEDVDVRGLFSLLYWPTTNNIETERLSYFTILAPTRKIASIIPLALLP